MIPKTTKPQASTDYRLQHTLTVALAERSYPIHIGTGLLDAPSLLAPHLSGHQVMVVTNETVAPLYLERVCQAMPEASDVRCCVLPDGEAYKSVDQVNRIWSALLDAGFNRHCTVVALGGGVIGDMAGFAAAAYQRGVAFIQIPTSLLAQVDSSVGGKTGVNHPLGKNMIGAFWQPKAVIIDLQTLSTLPPEEVSAGLAEVIKYGLIRDLDFLGWLETHMAALRDHDVERLGEAVARSCRIKAQIVAEDETEQNLRALLNLGHTFGHAIEAHQGYGRWLHGEAVGAGMAMAAALSARLGLIDEQQQSRVEAIIASAGLPRHAPKDMQVEDFLTRMRLDKKNIDTRLRLVLLKALGEAVIRDDSPVDILASVIADHPRA